MNIIQWGDGAMVTRLIPAWEIQKIGSSILSRLISFLFLIFFICGFVGVVGLEGGAAGN